MRVALVSGAREFAGAELYMVTLAEALAGEVSYAAIVSRDAPSELIDRLDTAGTDVHAVAGLRQRPTPHGVIGTFAALRRARADVVHLNLAFQGDGLGALIAARCARRPLVTTLHNIVPARSRAKELVARSAIRASGRVIAVSNGVATWVGPCTVVPNGVAPPDLIEGARQELGLPDAAVVGGIGRLHHQKGWDVLAKAADALDCVTVAVIGEGAERSRLAGTSLRLLGYRERASRFLRGFDVLAVPSRYEAFGLVAVEAMLAEVPVVASSVGGLPDVLGDAGLLVPPDDAGALADALRDLMADPARRAAMGRRGRERAERLFGVDRMAKETLAVYRAATGT